MTEKAQITRRSTMQEVLEAYPSAQRAVFQRYHIRGCNSCGYQPEDTLEQVAHNHNITDLDEASYFRATTFRALEAWPVGSPRGTTRLNTRLYAPAQG